jgi:hypothetical protein
MDWAGEILLKIHKDKIRSPWNLIIKLVMFEYYLPPEKKSDFI